MRIETRARMHDLTAEKRWLERLRHQGPEVLQMYQHLF